MDVATIVSPIDIGCAAGASWHKTVAAAMTASGPQHLRGPAELPLELCGKRRWPMGQQFCTPAQRGWGCCSWASRRALPSSQLAMHPYEARDSQAGANFAVSLTTSDLLGLCCATWLDIL
uniref:Uncharacterized protein n=1 Tax=Eutreptiella gymnastica TaxID=73025 RepID=A0A7S4FQF3_9EUGL